MTPARVGCLLLLALALAPRSPAAREPPRAPVVEESEEPFAPVIVTPTTRPASRPASQAKPRPVATRPPPPRPPRDEEVEEEDVIVVSATRTPLRLDEAPAIVTVISRDDIARLGYRTLEDVLRNVVGFEVNSNGHWPDTGVRGINDRITVGDKIQFLVDGHDMSVRQFNRNIHNLSWGSLDEVARIELVRGPGSAVWGANALNGVVNIVTREWTGLNTAEIVLGADHRFATQQLFTRAAITMRGLSCYASFNYYAANDDSLLPPLAEFERLGKGPVRVVGERHQGLGLNVKARWRWLRLAFHRSRFDDSAPLSTFSVIGGDDSRFITDRHIATLAFEPALGRGLELRAAFHFDDIRFADGTVYEANPGATTPGDPALGGSGRYLRKMVATDTRYEWKLLLSWTPTLSFSALAGVELEYLDLVRWYFPEVWQKVGLPIPEHTNWHLGTFAQVQWSPVRPLGLTAGVRFDYDQVYRGVVAPRAGVALRLPRGFALKALFGMAFKAPSFHDLYYFRKNAYYGNPALEPEAATTGEGQLIYHRPGLLDVRVTGFYTRIDKLIGYTRRDRARPLDNPDAFPPSMLPDATNPNTYYLENANLEFATTVGVEAEASLQPLRRLLIQAHFTYRVPRDHEGQRLFYSSRWTAGGALSVRILENLQASLRGLGVGNRMLPRQGLAAVGFPGWTADIDPTLGSPACFVATFVAVVSFLDRRLSATLKLDNLTNAGNYDAGLDVLYPRPRFQGMLWLSARM